MVTCAVRFGQERGMTISLKDFKLGLFGPIHRKSCKEQNLEFFENESLIG